MENRQKKTKGRICALLELYGPLLTEKQQQYTRMHYQQGIPFSEIASEVKVSRQSIYDTVNQAIATLEDYEKKLKLFERLAHLPEMAQPEAAETAKLTKPAMAQMENISNKLRQSLISIWHRIRHQRVIYNTDWLLRELNELISLINKEQ